MLSKIIKPALILSSAVLLVPQVRADEEYYAGGNVAILEYSDDFVSEDISLNALNVRLGMNFNDNFSSEIRLGLGVGEDSVTILGTQFNAELDNFYGIYLRGGIPVTEYISPYAVFGYTRGKISVSTQGTPGFSASVSESDISFGLGVDVAVSEKVDINFEYINYLDKDGGEIGGFSIGAAFKF